MQCLGRFAVFAGDEPVEQWTLFKARELLAFLLAHGGQWVGREQVVEALWPDYSWDASTRHLMSNAVSMLRSTLRKASGNKRLRSVVVVKQRMHLAAEEFDVDLDVFDGAIRRAAYLRDAEALAEYERAVSLYEGDFLGGEFFSWVDDYRQTYRGQLFEAARKGAVIAERLGMHDRAAGLYRAILAVEPIDEGTTRRLMRSLADDGDLAGARKAYRALSEAVQRELDDPGAAPSPETSELLAQLLNGERDGE